MLRHLLWPRHEVVEIGEHVSTPLRHTQTMARNYLKEYANYQGQPEQIKKRSQRNKARRALMKQGRVRKGDGKDVDHKRPISKGGSNSPSNLRVQSDNANRSFARDRFGRMRDVFRNP